MFFIVDYFNSFVENQDFWQVTSKSKGCYSIYFFFNQKIKKKM